MHARILLILTEMATAQRIGVTSISNLVVMIRLIVHHFQEKSTHLRHAVREWPSINNGRLPTFIINGLYTIVLALSDYHFHLV